MHGIKGGGSLLGVIQVCDVRSCQCRRFLLSQLCHISILANPAGQQLLSGSFGSSSTSCSRWEIHLVDQKEKCVLKWKDPPFNFQTLLQSRLCQTFLSLFIEQPPAVNWPTPGHSEEDTTSSSTVLFLPGIPSQPSGTNFDVQIRSADGDWRPFGGLIPVRGQPQQFSVQPLSPDTEYHFRFRYTQPGTPSSEYSNVLRVRTLPGMLANLSLVGKWYTTKRC